METILDIVKQTKKNNCGKCGYPTCMAFAAAVHTGASPRSACPYIELPGESGDVKERLEDPETALARELKSKVKDINLEQRAEGLGAKVEETDFGKALTFDYLGSRVYISPEKVFSSNGAELEPRDQILLYNYLFFGGKGELHNEFVGLESFPNSISKVVTLKKYTEDKLANFFAQKPQMLRERCEALGGKSIEPCHADVCMVVYVLPKVPVQIHFWDEDEDDGFSSEVKVLFNKRALDFLDIESLIFCGERLAETLTGE